MPSVDEIARMVEARLRELHEEETRLVETLEMLRKRDDAVPSERPAKERKKRQGVTNTDRIARFLADGQHRSVSEIADALGVERSSVSPTLTRMEAKGRVVHEGALWRTAEVPAQT
jgi:DNA-binding CsgD family transcriptional regulator